jgi:hypothetical protein
MSQRQTLEIWSFETNLRRVAAVGREQVAGTADSADDGRVRGIGLDLAPDAGDAHVDGAVERLAVARLGEVEQALAR